MKGAQAKRRLLEESVKLIAEQGLAALSFREMARRAGLSHQAPYHHFGSREGILAAIVLEGFTGLDAALVEARTINRVRPPAEGLKAVMKAYVTFALTHPVHFRVMFRPDVVPPSDHPDIHVQAELSFRRLVDAVSDCHPDAARAAPRFVEVVNALWASAHGVATLVLDGPVGINSPALDLDAFVETAMALFSGAGAKTDLIP